MVVEYEDKYIEDIRDLLVELEEYIISIDEDHLDRMDKDYREKMVLKDLESLQENEGKCFLYIDRDKVLGLIMGIVTKYDEYDYLDYTCPKKGDIIELIVTQKVRSKGIGRKLMDQMENYFREIGCEFIKISVFGYNHNAIQFYSNCGYHTRMIDMIKKL